MSITEKIQLLGQNLYDDIPNELTLKAIPTASELDYVGSEDFHDTMLNKILPQCIEEPINPKNLLEMDYYWVLRCLRIMNYGPYVKVGGIFCSDCDTPSTGEYMVDLRTVECNPIPKDFKNTMVIPAENFLSFNKSIEIKLPTIQEVQNANKDNQFKDAYGNSNRRFARICYMIKKIGGQPTDPITTRLRIQNDLEPADYAILQDEIHNLDNYGLRSGGKVKCPACGGPNGNFITFIDERFFRPDVDCLRKWGDDRKQRKDKDVSGTAERSVQSDSRRGSVHSKSL